MGEGGLGNVVVHDVRMVSISLRIDERAVVIDAEAGAERETLERLDIHVGITEEAPIVQAVVLVVIGFAQGILAVTHAAHGAGEGCAVLFIHRNDGRHLQRILHRGYVHLAGIGDGEVLAHGDVLVDVVRGVHAGRNVLEVRVLDDTVVLLVAQGEHRGRLVTGLGHRDVIVLCEARAGDGVQPVSVGVAHRAVLVDVAVIEAVHRIIHVAARGRVPNRDGRTIGGVQVQAVIAGVGHRVQSVVQGGLSHRRGISGGVEQLHHRLRRVELCRQVGIEVHLDLIALLALLGRDDDDAVRGTRTVDGGRCGILQHLHALDVTCVQRVQGTCRRHAVHDVQRVLRRIERTDTTDADRTHAARRAVGRNRHARHLALQGAHRVGI